MSKEETSLIKYHNNLNLLAFKKVTKLESSLFFSILSQLKDKGTEEITLEYREIIKYLPKNIGIEETRKALLSGSKKIVQAAVEWETEDATTIFTLFEKFYIPKIEEPYLKVKINKTFAFILNNLDKNFTLFEQTEFGALSSKYSQTLYRLLKQFRNTGFLVVDWNEFKDIMDIPKSYNIGTIDNRILNPVIKEFKEKVFFKGIKYTKIRSGRRGRPVVRIEFNFIPETEEVIEINNTDKEDLVFMLQREGVNKKTAKEYADKAEKADKIQIILEKFSNMVKRAEKHTSKQRYLIGAIRNEIDGIQQREITEVLPPRIKEEEKEFVYEEIPESVQKILEGFRREGKIKRED